MKKVRSIPHTHGNDTITTSDHTQPLKINYTGKEYNPDYTEITCNNGEAHNVIGV